MDDVIIKVMLIMCAIMLIVSIPTIYQTPDQQETITSPNICFIEGSFGLYAIKIAKNATNSYYENKNCEDFKY